jgi:hypothetical protein
MGEKQPEPRAGPGRSGFLPLQIGDGLHMQSPRIRLYSLLFLGVLISISLFLRMEMLSASVARASFIFDAKEYFAYAYNAGRIKAPWNLSGIG